MPPGTSPPPFGPDIPRGRYLEYLRRGVSTTLDGRREGSPTPRPTRPRHRAATGRRQDSRRDATRRRSQIAFPTATVHDPRPADSARGVGARAASSDHGAAGRGGAAGSGNRSTSHYRGLSRSKPGEPSKSGRRAKAGQGPHARWPGRANFMAGTSAIRGHGGPDQGRTRARPRWATPSSGLGCLMIQIQHAASSGSRKRLKQSAAMRPPCMPGPGLTC